MNAALSNPCNTNIHTSNSHLPPFPFLRSHFQHLPKLSRRKKGHANNHVMHPKRLSVSACSGGTDSGGGGKKTERRSFLSLEEAGLVEISGLSTHERFLCRLTISSLNLLRVISEQEGCSIEELNAGRVCDWFLKDKLKREQNLDSAVLQWDDPDFQF